ncbi:MAG: glutathione S-transferase family protein [Myxococcota bacterium]
MQKIKLYGYATSPFVRKTGAFLYYKGLDFEHVPVNPIEPEKAIGHTGGTQVPVLEIDGEWRTESSDHAHWLDELFPERPLCPAEQQEVVRELDAWASDFLHSGFRAATEGAITAPLRTYLWRMAAIVSADTPLSASVQSGWPEFVSQAPFIRAMRENMDLTESLEAMRARLGQELLQHLGDGPYLGGLPNPSMVDLAIFPNIGFPFIVGLEDTPAFAHVPKLRDWFLRVAEHLPENPVLVQDFLVVNSPSSI